MTRQKAESAKPVVPGTGRKSRGSDRKSNSIASEVPCVPAPTGTVTTSKPLAEDPGGAVVECSRRSWGELPEAERTSRSKQLEEMGFTAAAAQKALTECAWDVNKALDHLFTHGDLMMNTTERAADNPQSTSKSSVRKNLTQKTWQSDEDDSSKNASIDSLAGESTSASGVSTPCCGTGNSPQKDLLSNASVESLGANSRDETRLSLPPGLEQLSGLLVSPPGLDNLATEDNRNSLPISQQAGSATVADALLVPTNATLPRKAASTTTHPPVWPVGAVSSVMPKRRLTKVQHTWECEPNCSNSQMGVEEGTFINVWLGSKTENGWTYAESLICCNRVGWLPNSMLQELPANKQWMRVSIACKASYQSQLAVEAGSIVLIDISRCSGGWAYAEEQSTATGRQVSGKHSSARWVPIQCLEWSQF